MNNAELISSIWRPLRTKHILEWKPQHSEKCALKLKNTANATYQTFESTGKCWEFGNSENMKNTRQTEAKILKEKSTNTETRARAGKDFPLRLSRKHGLTQGPPTDFLQSFHLLSFINPRSRRNSEDYSKRAAAGKQIKYWFATEFPFAFAYSYTLTSAIFKTMSRHSVQLPIQVSTMNVQNSNALCQRLQLQVRWLSCIVSSILANLSVMDFCINFSKALCLLCCGCRHAAVRQSNLIIYCKKILIQNHPCTIKPDLLM